MTESILIALISIGIAVNTLLNVVWLYLIRDLSRRIERIENLFINKTLQE